jgi:hypothetical protein
MPITTSTATKNAQGELERLRKTKKELSQQLRAQRNKPSGPKTAAKIKELEERISEIDASIEQLSANACQAATPASLAKSSSKGGTTKTKSNAENTANTLIDAALRVFGTVAEHDFFTFDGTEKIIPLIGGVAGIDVGLQGGVKVEATVSRHQRGLQLQGALKGDIEPNIGLGVGIDIPYIGSYKLAGGIQGGANAEATTGFILEVQNSALVATVNRLNIGIKMVAKMYLVIPFSTDSFAQYLKAIDKLDASGNRVTYELGSLEILTVVIASSRLSFDVSRRRFDYQFTAFSVTVNQSVKDAVNDIIDGIKSAARSVGDALNPVNQARNVINFVDSLIND